MSGTAHLQQSQDGSYRFGFRGQIMLLVG